MQATAPFCERVEPQQLAVGASGGCEIKILGLNLELEAREREGADFINVALDMKNAHSSFSRAAAQKALDLMAAGSSSLLALAQGIWADTSFPIDVYMRGHTFECARIEAVVFLLSLFPWGAHLAREEFSA